MSRPAISYNATVRTSCNRYYYNAAGVLQSHNVIANRALGWRMLNKTASVTTQPRKGGKFTHPTNYVCSWGRASCIPGETFFRSAPYNAEYTIVPDDCVSILDRNPLAFYSPGANTWNELEIKALNKLRNQKVNFGVALAEAKETAKLFTSNAKSIARGFQKLPFATRQAARRYAGRVPSKVPSRYLEYMYGVNPLLSDIQGACTLLNELQIVEGNEFQVRSRKIHSGSHTQTYGLYNGSCWSQVSRKGHNVVQLKYVLSCPTLALLSTLGLVNPAEIFWERVPLSFVVDWLVPVGNWLSALSGAWGYTFIDGFQATFCDMEENNFLNPYPPGSPGDFTAGVRVLSHFGYFKRVLYGSSPVPGLYLKSPVSAHHIAEALSLLATSFRR